MLSFYTHVTVMDTNLIHIRSQVLVTGQRGDKLTDPTAPLLWCNSPPTSLIRAVLLTPGL